MYAKISVYLAGFCIIFVQVKVAGKPDTNGFAKRFNQKREVSELTVCKANVGSTCFKDLIRLFCSCSSMEGLDEINALTKLDEESCAGRFHNKSSPMCKAFEMAKKTNCVNFKNYPVEGLLAAECRAVSQYTAPDFFREYNTDTRIGRWEPYRVFTTLLYSALVKLKKMNPNPAYTKLYRGLKKKFKVPESGGFYFNQFTSTSLNLNIAKGYGSETLIYFDDVPILAPRIIELSLSPDEEEFLISPFEAFEFVRKNGNELHLKSAKKQDILNKNRLELCVSGHAPPMVSGVVVVYLLLIKAFAVYLVNQ